MGLVAVGRRALRSVGLLAVGQRAIWTVKNFFDNTPPAPTASLWHMKIGAFRSSKAVLPLSPEERRIVDDFHNLYYSRLDQIQHHAYIVSWLGYELLKCPLDLWMYQELITEQRPDVIIETGTFRGGSALYMATICDEIGHGEIVSIDVNSWFDVPRPAHPRITYLRGSSTDEAILSRVEQCVAGRQNIMVILDSDHARNHVLSELRAYARFIPFGGWLIVEDTNVNGHPTYKTHGPGPWEAVEVFLAENREFIADPGCERSYLTMNPGGFLRRISTPSI